MRVVYSGPNEPVDQFVGRMTSRDNIPLNHHFGCIFYGQTAGQYPYHKNCCTLTQFTHPGMTFTTHLCNVNIEDFDFCLGGVHDSDVSRSSLKSYVSHTVIAQNVTVNGKPLEGTFFGAHQVGTTHMLYTRRSGYERVAPVISPLFNPINTLHCNVFSTLVLPFIIDSLSDCESENLAPVLANVMALRLTCRALFYNPQLQALSTRLYLCTRTKNRRREAPAMYSLWDPDHPRLWLDSFDLSRFLVQGPQWVNGATRSSVISPFRYSFFQAVRVIASVIEAHGLDKEVTDKDVSVHFALLIPVKPRSFHRPGYMYGSWLIGRREQFGPSGWFQKRCFKWLERVARVFEECGYGYDGRKFYYCDLVKAAFKAAPVDRTTGLRRVLYRLLWLQRALLAHEQPVRVEFDDLLYF